MEATLAPPRPALLDQVNGALSRSPYVSGNDMRVEAAGGVVRLEGASQRIIDVAVGLVTADRIEIRPVLPATLQPDDLLVLNPNR